MNLYDRNQKQRSFFNEKIDTYDQVHSSYMATKNSIADNLSSNTKRILDLGVGTGLELIHIFELFPDVYVTAIDITENMLEELSKRDFSDKVNSICGDFFEVDFGENYDAVISTSALHHFKPEEKKVLYKKIYDSLKEDGLFINSDKISLSQEDQDTCFYELEHNFENYKHMDTPLTVENEVNLLKEVGFKNITVDLVYKDDYRLIKAQK